MRHPLRLAIVLIAAGAFAAGCSKAGNTNAGANGANSANTTAPVPPTNITTPTSNISEGANVAANQAVNALKEQDLKTNDKDTNLSNGM